MRIGFLINDAGDLARILPIALAMARDRHADVVIVTTAGSLAGEIHRRAEGLEVEIEQLGLKRLLAAGRGRTYRENAAFFCGLDALVTADDAALVLKSRVKLFHAGNSATGLARQFDHVLVPGANARARLVRDAGLSPDHITVVGDPRLDRLANRPARLPFADSGKPTVLYSPHASPHLSSWFRHGLAVLEHFQRDDRYNLLFAPHPELFDRAFVIDWKTLRINRPGVVDRRFYDAPNIHIDLGSDASTGGSYAAAADVYLGDAGSRLFDVLRTPKPCLFLDRHAPCQVGEAIGSVADLGAALDRAVRTHDRYRPIQRALFRQSVDVTAEPSADRAARAILSVLAPRAPQSLAAIRGDPIGYPASWTASSAASARV